MFQNSSSSVTITEFKHLILTLDELTIKIKHFSLLILFLKYQLYSNGLMSRDLTVQVCTNKRTKPSHVSKASQKVFDRALSKQIPSLLRVAIGRRKGISCIFKNAHSMAKD